MELVEHGRLDTSASDHGVNRIPHLAGEGRSERDRKDKIPLDRVVIVEEDSRGHRGDQQVVESRRQDLLDDDVFKGLHTQLGCVNGSRHVRPDVLLVE